MFLYHAYRPHTSRPAPPAEHGPTLPMTTNVRCRVLPEVRLPRKRSDRKDAMTKHTGTLNTWGHQAGTSASTRTGLPLPCTIFSGAAITTAPVGGS